MGYTGGSRFGDRAPETEYQPPIGSLDTPERAAAWHWATAHAGESLTNAFLAGIAWVQTQQPAAVPRVQPPPPSFHPAGRAARTIASALSLFRDQVLLALEPEEQALGEFLSVEDVDQMIEQFRQKGAAGA